MCPITIEPRAKQGTCGSRSRELQNSPSDKSTDWSLPEGPLLETRNMPKTGFVGLDDSIKAVEDLGRYD